MERVFSSPAQPSLAGSAQSASARQGGPFEAIYAIKATDPSLKLAILPNTDYRLINVRLVLHHENPGNGRSLPHSDRWLISRYSTRGQKATPPKVVDVDISQRLDPPENPDLIKKIPAESPCSVDTPMLKDLILKTDKYNLVHPIFGKISFCYRTLKPGYVLAPLAYIHTLPSIAGLPNGFSVGLGTGTPNDMAQILAGIRIY